MRRQTINQRFKTNPKNRVKIRRSPLKVAAISESRGCIDQNDMSKAKRLKFTLPEQIRPPKTDEPKTSEFAFFKRLKENIGGYYSRPLHRDGTYQPKAATANDRSQLDTSIPSDVLKYDDRNLRSSLQSESERPTGQYSFLSPPMCIEPNDVYGLNGTEDEYKGTKQRSSFASSNVTPDGKNMVFSPFARASNPSETVMGLFSGNENAGSEIFSIKRQRLRQLVADSFPVVGQCSSDGFDMISSLLSRLFPNGEKKERFRHANFKEGVLDTNYKLADVPGLDAEEEFHTRNETKFEHASRWADYFPEYWSSRPTERVLSKWEVTTSNVPLIEYKAETGFQEEEVNLNHCLDGKAMKTLFRARDSSHYSYGSVSSGHLQELDNVPNSNESERRTSQRLLLSWDVDQGKEPTFCSALATSSGVAYQQILNDSLDATNVDDASFWFSDHTLYCNLLSYTHSTGDCWHEYGRNHEDDYAFVAANQLYSFNPQYFVMAKHWDTTCNLLEEENLGLDWQDHPGFTCEEYGRKDHSEALLIDDSGWKNSSMSKLYGEEDYSSKSHSFHFPLEEGINAFGLEKSSLYPKQRRDTSATFSGDPFDTPNWFSANLHGSPDKLLGHSLLLGNSAGGVRSEDEIHFDDDDDRWKSC